MPDMDKRPEAGPVETDPGRWWNLLLLIPIVLPLCPFLFNVKEPAVFGFPFFYWFQLLLLPVLVVVTVVVYQLTKRRS